MGATNSDEGDFLSIIAHELATPVTVVMAMVDTLSNHRRDLTEAEFEDFLNHIRRQAERLHFLLTALVDDAKVENGRFIVVPQTVDLLHITKRGLENAPPPAGKVVEVAVPEGPSVVADPGRLDQVLVNLLHNAYRYGGPKIRLEARETAEGMLVTLSDDGDGVPQDLLPHLFERFSRGANATGVQGSGLGLALARDLVVAFGGEMWYEPDTLGASFKFTLPVADGVAESLGQQAQ